MKNQTEGTALLESLKTQLGENATLAEAINWFTVEENAKALLEEIKADQKTDETA